MPFNINAWKANGLVYGGARPALFNVKLNVPPAIGIADVSVRKFTFTCTTASIPEGSVGAIPVGYFGRQIKVAGDRTYNSWAITVLNDEDFSVRSLFEKWQNGINSAVANVRNPQLSEEEYKVDLEVIQYSKDGEAIRSYMLQGAFPTTLGAMDLDWDQQNQVQRFNVAFEYDLWVPIVEESSKKVGGVNKYIDQTEIDGPLGPA